MSLYFCTLQNNHQDNSSYQLSLFFFFSGSRTLLVSFFLKFIFISWKLITLQYYSGFCHTVIWINHGFTHVPHPDPPSHFSPSHPSGSSQCTSPEHLSHASNLDWWSVSPLIIYMFRCLINKIKWFWINICNIFWWSLYGDGYLLNSNNFRAFQESFFSCHFIFLFFF